MSSKLWSGILFGGPKKWDNQPGGTVVDTFTEYGVDYVYVEFEKSPGIRYLYRA